MQKEKPAEDGPIAYAQCRNHPHKKTPAASPFPRRGNRLAQAAPATDRPCPWWIDALASALVTPWSWPSTLAAPAVASSNVARLRIELNDTYRSDPLVD